MKIEKYLLPLVGNLDETIFGIIPSKCLVSGCVVPSSRSENKHLTVVLPGTADEEVLPPMVIFKKKTDQTVRTLNIPPGFIVKTQEKAWIDDDLIKIWVKDIWSQ